MGVPRFVLASGSPSRLALLRSAGLEPEVVVSQVDEAGIDDVLELARRKARAVASTLGPGTPALVLGCDSMLEFEGVRIGKPTTPDIARARWRQFRGNSGILRTGHHVIDTARGRFAEGLGSTTVRFAGISDAEIEAYVSTNEPLAVAGGFKIEGLASAFVERIEGDHHNVVGLSIPLLRSLLTDLGYFWPDFWTGRS